MWSARALATAAAIGPDAHLGDQLDADPRARVDRAQVVDQLGEVLDRVHVVVRWGRDEPDAGGGVTQPRDGDVHLVAGQLAALTGLGALGDLDLDLVGVDEEVGGDPEPRGRHLLDGAAAASRRRRVAKRAASSPPSPVLERPPMRFIAMASVSCISGEIEPSDIAPVAKRCTSVSALSTSSSGTGGLGLAQREQAAQGAALRRTPCRRGRRSGRTPRRTRSAPRAAARR